MEEYKNIIIDNEVTYYRIYKDGRVFSEKTKNFYLGTITQGYKWYDLRWKNKKYRKSEHRLIAEYFIDNPLKLEYVNHKDGNRLNNDISNLEWVTASENNLAINRHITNKDHTDYNEYDETTELWRTYKDTIYMISNQGRVKNCTTNKILKGKITDSGYREYCLTINHKKKSFSGHRLVYEVWGEDNNLNIINHIDGNKLNNRIENLENVSSQENNLKAIYETKTRRFKRTAQYDTEGNLIQIFENNADAARHMGVRPQSIQIAIKKGNKSCGYYWKNLD